MPIAFPPFARPIAYIGIDKGQLPEQGTHKISQSMGNLCQPVAGTVGVEMGRASDRGQVIGAAAIGHTP
ncbi:MAG: hypothetical protein AAFW84_19215 [Cyanobacteria bacterium J06635_15]